ncbi:NAD-dependent histone deacetylase sir2 [Coemansia sp. RSA 1290]|nr:NAD-dependent histone deacetylase sir2 [Coemansia sp. RSA 1290]KAJ2650599.1 NAD-dependent histone deacetylase sir2 [Coemansia sp. RSA 1250]
MADNASTTAAEKDKSFVKSECLGEERQNSASVNSTSHAAAKFNSASSTSLNSIKRRGIEAANQDSSMPDAFEAPKSSKRHRCEATDPPTIASENSSEDEDYKAENSSKTDDEDINIDGSYAASPLTNIETVQYTRFTSEEMELIKSEARSLGMIEFLQEYVVRRGISVRSLLEGFGAPLILDSSIHDLQLLPLLKRQLVYFYRDRPKLEHINTIDDVVDLIKNSKRILVLTGAGVSVSCGIPDFRSPQGIYTRLNEEFGLDDPQQMFDIDYFRETPEMFYSFAKELYPYNFKPAPSHAFVKLLEEKGKLLRNYTQNIDTLEHVQGIQNVLNCHGSFATATCIKCGFKCDGKELEAAIMNKQIAYCPQCKDQPKEVTSPPTLQGMGSETAMLLGGNINDASHNDDDDDDDNDDDYGAIKGIMKPDITFFGEKLPDQFDEALLLDREQVDLLLVMGSSLKVAPVSDIMSHLPHTVPQIVINKTPILHFKFDVQLLGDADDIVAYLAKRCGWELQHERIPGGSTASAEFELSEPNFLNYQPEPVAVEIHNPNSEGSEPIQKMLEVPASWHLFPSAVVTARDLLVSNGESKLRLAVYSSDEGDSVLSDELGSDEENEESGGSDNSELLAQDISKASV